MAAAVDSDTRVEGPPGAALASDGWDLIYRYGCGPEGRLEYVSPNCVKLLGYSADELMGDPQIHLKLVHPQDRERLAHYVSSAVFDGQPQTFSWMRKNGSVWWAEQRDVAVLDGCGQLFAVEGLLRDVGEHVRATARLVAENADIERRFAARTQELLESNQRLRQEAAERLQAEQHLRDSERRYRKMFESAAVSLWEEDFSALRQEVERLKAQGVRDLRAYIEANPSFVQHAAQLVEVLDVNEATLRMFHASSKEQLLGNLDRTFVPESSGAFVEAVLAVAEGRRYIETERLARTLDGKRLNVLVRAHLPPGDEEARSLVSMVDLTEEKIRRLYVEDVLAAQDEERRRIARELHDEAGQSLTSIAVGLQQIQQAHTLQVAHDLSSRLQGIAEATTDEIGRLARGLHPYMLEDLGLKEALQRYVEELSCRSDLEIDFEMAEPDGSGELPKALATALYRIVQETLRNVIKHAEAHNVSVVITRHRHLIRLVVEDDGCGFDVATLELTSSGDFGLGLHAIRERVALLGGTMAVESTAGVGATIAVQIPL